MIRTLLPIVATGLITAVSVYVAMSNRIAIMETKVDILTATINRSNEAENRNSERLSVLESRVDAIERSSQ